MPETTVKTTNSPITTLKNLRHKASLHEITQNDRIKAAAGSITATAAALFALKKMQNAKNIFSLKYELKDTLILTASAVSGGVAVGAIGETKEAKIHKLKEGVFQFFNTALPAAFVALTAKFSEQNKLSLPAKLGLVVSSIIAGAYTSVGVSNAICDPFDKEPDRKLTMKDFAASADDLAGALVMAKLPFADKLPLDKFLPVIYAYCGYRAGESN